MTAIAGILGNVNIDLIMGPLPRQPAYGHELIVPMMMTRASGAAGYTAMALDRLGMATVVVGTIGDDHWADFIKRELARYACIDLGGVESVGGAGTGLSVALLNARGERGFVTYSGALDHTDAAFLARQEGRLLACTFLLVCGYFFMPALRGEPMRAFLRRARKAGVIAMLDTGWDLDDWPSATRDEVLSLLPDVDVFLPNLDEARALTGQRDAEACAGRLLACGAGAVGLKLGPQGSLWADSRQVVHKAGRPVKALDTTGAGDSFNAALMYGMAQGWAMACTLEFANAFCSVVVSRLHDRFPSPQETLALI